MLLYYLTAPFLYLLAYLPTGILYGLADVLAFILQHIIRYRKEVVLNNLRNSFPNKTEGEIKKIASEFYGHLADRIVENIRCIAIGSHEIDERIEVSNPQMLQDLYKSGKNVVLMIGHVAAWEFCTYKLGLSCRYRLYGIASRVHNPYFDRMIQRTRGKMGMELIHMQDSAKFFRQKLNERSLVVFVNDQSPSTREKACWTEFLNQQTAFFKGGERYARMHNCVVLYPKIQQVKRGYYNAELIKITDAPNELADNGVTKEFARLLEQQINENPADWLWSHRRWKHKPV